MPFENAANKTKHSYELPKGVAQQFVDLNKNSCFFLSITNLTLVFTFLRNVCFIILTPPLWSKQKNLLLALFCRCFRDLTYQTISILTYFNTSFTASLFFKYDSQSEMNFIGTIKAGVYIQHLLKDLYCPVEQNQIHNFFRYKLSFQVVPDGLGVLLKPFFVTD